MKRLAEQSLYEILEVPSDAAPPEIENAYAKARELYGPGSLATYSLMPAEEAALLAERIEEAKRVLLDPEARKRYDAALSAVAGAAEAAVRIAATGSGAVAAGPQRPFLVPSIPAARTPPPAPARAAEPPNRQEALQDALQEALKDAPKETAPKAEPASPAEPESPKASAPAPSEGAPPAPGPILLKHEVAEPPARELHVPEGTVWTGEALRRVREGRGLSVREVCDRTKITRYHLENIEADRFTLLPAPVYLRGIILAVARELRLDGQKVARSYLERMTGGADSGSR